MSQDLRRLPRPLPPHQLGELRRWTHSWMQAHPTGADPDSVLLALTELVSNAARHGSGPIEVELSGHSGRLLLRVSDGSSALPRQQGPADQAAESGRGIVLVDAVTSQWGVLLQPHGGKTVWCEFRPAPIG